MNQTEINQELEILSNAFKISVSNHFTEKGLNIQLKTLDFTIIKLIDEDNNIEVLEKDKEKPPAEIIVLHCYINEQGQTVCRN